MPQSTAKVAAEHGLELLGRILPALAASKSSKQ
jgi:hypothetical protein